MTVSRSTFKTSVPPTLMTSERWRTELAKQEEHRRRHTKPVRPIKPEPTFEPCRRESCHRPGLHAAESCLDEVKPPRDPVAHIRSRRQNAKKDYKEPFKLIRYEASPRGKVAIVECFSCKGAGTGCRDCYGTGDMPLVLWWQKKNAASR